jgi:hypothetical protein
MKYIYLQKVTTAVAVLVLISYVVESFPNGAGGCMGGAAAVGGLHLDYGPGSDSGRPGGNGTLEEAEITVAINGLLLDPNTTATFDSFTDLTWTVESSQIPYRGILVRVQAPDDLLFTNMGTETDLKVATACVENNVIGVTHVNNTFKSVSTGALRFDGQGSATIDVTIVFQNDAALSLYAYSGYQVNIGEVVEAPSELPSEIPSAAPSPGVEPETSSPKPSSAPAPMTPTPPVDVPVVPPKKEPEGKGMSMEKCPDGKGGMMMGKGGMMMGKGGMMMGEDDDDHGKGSMMMGKGKGYDDECEYASDAPSDSPSASPTATPPPTKSVKMGMMSGGKDKGGMMSGGKGSDGSMMGKGSGKGSDGSMMGKGGKGSDDEDEGKGKGGKGGKGSESEEGDEEASEETEAPEEEEESEGSDDEESSKGKGGMGMDRFFR